MVLGDYSFLPTRTYRVRINQTEKKTSGAGYNMIAMKMEIIHPEAVDVEGKAVTVAGRKFTGHLMLVPGQAWGTREYEFCDKLGIQLEKDDEGVDIFDDTRHAEYFRGVEFDTELSSTETFKTYPKQPGEKEGKPILDGEGNKISRGFMTQFDVSRIPDGGLANPSKVETAY